MKKAWPPTQEPIRVAGRVPRTGQLVRRPNADRRGRRAARADADCSDRTEAASHPVRLSFVNDTLGTPRGERRPEGFTQRKQTVPGVMGSHCDRFSLRRARSARPRPSAFGLHERSAGDDADTAAAGLRGGVPGHLSQRFLSTYFLAVDVLPVIGETASRPGP